MTSSSLSDTERATAIDRLLESLRAMHDQAEGGLQWYYGTRHQAVVKNRWLKDLSRRLTAASLAIKTNTPYPAEAGGRCDLHFTFENKTTLWLEVIGVWKEYMRRIGQPRSYKSVLFHPLLPNMEDRSNSVPNCLARLRALDKDATATKGLLLLGFDTPDQSLNQEVRQLEQLADLNESNWSTRNECWTQENDPQARTNLWLWVEKSPG